jgi:hypothetical protein
MLRDFIKQEIMFLQTNLIRISLETGARMQLTGFLVLIMKYANSTFQATLGMFQELKVKTFMLNLMQDAVPQQLEKDIQLAMTFPLRLDTFHRIDKSLTQRTLDDLVNTI